MADPRTPVAPKGAGDPAAGAPGRDGADGTMPAADAFGFPSTWPAVSVDIWRRKYRFVRADGTPVDKTWRDTARRVARAAARVEAEDVRAEWRHRFEAAIASFAFLPAGRILAGAGTKRRVTLFNCFVMGRIEDDLSSIFDQVKLAALTMQQGGGIGHDFSTLRPKGARVASIGADASGPVTFMDVWDAMCRTIMSAGQRRGAMMATLRCDHPDIEAFVDAKRDPRRLRNFNLSVLVTDAFVDAVRQDAAWPLVFGGQTYRTVPARDLWQRIMRATYETAEPGVIFIDRINALNNLAYCETIAATNPCGEQPLPPYGACLLGSINLARLVADPFTPAARLDVDRLADVTATAVRFLDDVIDVSGYPLKEQQAEAKAKRRIGLGVTGLADALIMLGLNYADADARRTAAHWFSTLSVAAYRASAALAAEKGAFPLCDADALLARPGLAELPPDVRAAITATGLRNGLVTSIAPTGTISLLAGNVSSGIEPVFDVAYDRRMLEADGSTRTERVEDYAYALYRRIAGAAAPLPPAFVTAERLPPSAHLAMQATAQRHVDSAISKTINCPADIDVAAFETIYLEAFDQGLKGVTTYRPNTITGAVLSHAVDTAAAPPGAAPPTSASTVAPEPVTTRSVAPHRSVPALPDTARASARTPAIVYMTQPLSRDPVLAGYTYKLKWPGTDHALYITINDIESAGRRRPFEIFINTKSMEHQAWIVALTRMISAVFRRGGDLSFIAEELRAIVDPQGGRWMDGRYVPSLIAAIGDVIALHLSRIGGAVTADATDIESLAAHPLPGPRATPPPAPTQADGQGLRDRIAPRVPDTPGTDTPGPGFSEPPRSWSAEAGRPCPRCSAPAYYRREGCWVCGTCGHTSCG